MQRPRHRNLAATFLTPVARGRALAFLLLLALVSVTGCRDDSGRENARQAAEYRRALDSSGKRVLIVDADGERVAKLRKRRGQIKVYGDDLKALGYVRWDRPKPAAPTSASNGPFGVRVKALGSEDILEIIAVDGSSEAPRVFELPGRFRIVMQPPAAGSEAHRSWKILGPEGELLGIFNRSGDAEWQLLTDLIQGGAGEGGAEFEADYRVKEVDSGAERLELRRDGKVVASIRFGELSALEFLALKLDKLPALERVSVGVWLANNAS